MVLSNFLQTISLQARGGMFFPGVPFQNTDQAAVVVSGAKAEAKATINEEIAAGSWHTKPTRVMSSRII